MSSRKLGYVVMLGIMELDVSGVEKIRRESSVVFVDVRTEAEVARGGIAGAAHIPLYLLPLKADELCQRTPTIFYCQSGARSAQACVFLTARGFNNVFNLQGGMMAWLRAGQPLGAVV